MHVTWCSALLSPCFCKGGTVIASVSPSVCLLCYLLLNHWTKSNQVWCASYSYEWGVQQHVFGIPLGPRGRFKGQLSSLKSQFQRFLYQTFLIVLTNKRIGILIMSPGSYPRGGTWGCWMSKIYFSKHGHVAYLIEGDGEQNGVQVKCSPYGQTCVLEME